MQVSNNKRELRSSHFLIFELFRVCTESAFRNWTLVKYSFLKRRNWNKWTKIGTINKKRKYRISGCLNCILIFSLSKIQICLQLYVAIVWFFCWKQAIFFFLQQINFQFTLYFLRKGNRVLYIVYFSFSNKILKKWKNNISLFFCF